MIAAAGRMLASGRRFSFADYQLSTAVLDIDATRMSRARSSGFAAQSLHDPTGVVRCEFAYPATLPRPAETAPEVWEKGSSVKEEEFARAVALGLFDYPRKSRSRGFVVSLSGGADSAAVATLCALTIHLGIAQ